MANAPDFRVLRARGLESKSSLPFAGLYDLFRGTAGSWGLLPTPQADALRGALALGSAAEADRLVCAASVLSLLGVLAEQQATLVIVDDAQWLDEPTLETLLFAARRLEADRVAVLLAHRAGPGRAEGVVGIPTLVLRGWTFRRPRNWRRCTAGGCRQRVWLCGCTRRPTGTHSQSWN